MPEVRISIAALRKEQCLLLWGRTPPSPRSRSELETGWPGAGCPGCPTSRKRREKWGTLPRVIDAERESLCSVCPRISSAIFSARRPSGKPGGICRRTPSLPISRKILIAGELLNLDCIYTMQNLANTGLKNQNLDLKELNSSDRLTWHGYCEAIMRVWIYRAQGQMSQHLADRL